MSQFRLNRRHALKALGYGALLTLSACSKKTIVVLTATSAPTQTPTSTPYVPTGTPEPAAAATPVGGAVATMQKSQPLLRPTQVKGLHVPYTFLEEPIDYPALERVMLGTGADSVVIDIKVEGGKIAVPFEHPLTPSYTNNPGFDYDQVAELVDWLLAHQYYPVARQVVMNDTPLATAHPELAYYFYTSQPYVDVSGEVWLNPARPEVADYNAAIAVAAAKMGFREVQLDYIRYPEADFDKPIEKRIEAIENILKTIKSALKDQALLTIDVLDDSTRDYPESIADGGYGQHIATLAKTVDGICPMLYPDIHHQNIEVDYFQFVHDGTARTVEKVVAGLSTAFVNPWIQAYYPAGQLRIRQQADGAVQAGAVGVYAWNNALYYPHEIFESIS